MTGETMLWRVHRTTGPHLTAWNALRHVGPVATCRYDPHEPPTGPGKSEGVAYLAATVRTALAEAFQARRLFDRHTGAPSLIGMRLTRTVQLLDLSRSWPTRAGASQAISSGRRDTARAWARAIRGAFPNLDGLWYPSSMDGGSACLTLWTPAADALPAAPVLSRPLTDPSLADRLAGAADRLGYRML
ncbi:MAG: RES family NAD+ phosphorylase [Mycobacteriales bacterium]